MVKSTIRVVARTRPTDSFASDALRIQDDNKSVQVHISRRTDADIINNAQEDHNFKLDLLLRDASQEVIYDTCAADVVKSAVAGYNGTLMCYGQTGAGKTYTMMGGGDYRTRGVVPRALKAVYDEIGQQVDKTFEVRVSYMEIYNERIRDLLEPSSVEDFAIQEDAKGSISVRGLAQKSCLQEAEALALLFEGNTNRAVAEHSLNAASSRSHCIFTVYITSRSRVESESASLVSKLHCIDLAGSERLSKTGSEGKIMKEAQFINKSLTFLEQVVIALGSTSRSHIPFRQSKLTNILKDSLGGNSKTTMVANVWPEERHMDETISTLKFAQRMMHVQSDVSVNMVLDPATHVKQLQRQITELKAELQMQNQLHGKSHIQYEGELGEDERFEMEKTVRSYLEGRLQEVGIKSLREVKEYFKIFKACYDSRDAELRASGVGIVAPDGHPPDSAAGTKGDQKKASAVIEPSGTVDHTGGLSVGVGAPAKSLKDVMKTTVSPRPPSDYPVSPHNLSQDMDLGSGGEFDEKSPTRGEAPDRNVAFEDYKRTEGQRLSNLLRDTQAQLLAKKRSIVEVGRKINDLGVQISSLTAQLEERRVERQARGEEEVVDDEEFALVRQAKLKKAEYRHHYDDLNSAKVERDHLAKSADQTRQKMLAEFDKWYEESFLSASRQGAGGAGSGGEEELLDEGERFEKLELHRVMDEDPESVAYYTAKKSTISKAASRKANYGRRNK